MGKARKNRVRANRADPIAKAVKPPSDPELAALRESRILPVVKDLQSADIKSRTAAAGAIANIVQDTKCRKLLLREQIVPIVLTETLTDNSIDSRAAGWEILKVLVQEEESDFCVHLYRLDLLTAIEHAAKALNETLASTEPPFAKLTKAQQRIVWDMSNSLLVLLNSLALARDEILDAIVANQNVIRFLFRIVATDVVPQESFEETLSCLMTLSEDNLPLGQAITDDQETRCYDKLLELVAAGGPRSVLACGVLHNVFASLQWLDHSPGKDGACDAVLVPSLSKALEQPPPSNKDNGQADSWAQMMQAALEIVASIGTDLQTALEKGNRPVPGAAAKDEEWNGIEDTEKDDDAMDVDEGSGDDNDEDEDKEDEEEDDEEEGDSDDEEFDEADLEKVTGMDSEDESEENLDDLPTLRELINKAIPQLIRLTNIAVDDDNSIAIQGHAISALNNIAWTISCIDFSEGENTNIWKAWAPAGKRIWQRTISPILEADNADLQLATQLTSLAWAVARSLSGTTPLGKNEHRKFMSLYQVSKAQQNVITPDENKEQQPQEDPFQGLGVKCIGVLGALARDPAPIDINREVGVFLMTLLGSAGEPGVAPADIIQALNEVFDIYGDEEYTCDAEVFWKDGFLSHLEELQPKLKAVAKGINKRTFEELRIKADEAMVNLGRFVQYKKKHAPKSKEVKK
ncbi:hypothetical protein SMACR_04804 [Sordaria macrospora]|uniref:WGS project CABT00000000 data, contig 2.21 n=2 Tax=Sordaria macrospora TaxID=5147 RepID=F7W2H2_SORMK|nr:uncharacterized protein SMAC_04804 [Sordaria macrospora k-hell]KAA8636678.1 hypothetical protein SMACR_04804 [Sordaria macrospora]KAH7630807.1 hypothetical protein B0T09DRAFT_125399 [Sordaria sp. MPI-SDFR-AT-0083]WPJ62078.1 hypothetical protein SMAC4_04804 [Sordaria macrospora]CCC11823.1 unnamed protein product [Sordaria macrospora k-hell]